MLRNKAKHAFTSHYGLHGIMNYERGGRGQQRTGEACFIISLPTESAPPLPVCGAGLEVHHEEAVQEEWAGGGGAREGRKQERRKGAEEPSTLLKPLAFMYTPLRTSEYATRCCHLF